MPALHAPQVMLWIMVFAQSVALASTVKVIWKQGCFLANRVQQVKRQIRWGANQLIGVFVHVEQYLV
jgi:hypothetical protein